MPQYMVIYHDFGDWMTKFFNNVDDTVLFFIHMTIGNDRYAEIYVRDETTREFKRNKELERANAI